jgi:hypothetical protein
MRSSLIENWKAFARSPMKTSLFMQKLMRLPVVYVRDSSSNAHFPTTNAASRNSKGTNCRCRCSRWPATRAIA